MSINSRPTGLALLVSAKVFGTLFTHFVYGALTVARDAERYLAATPLELTSYHRTALTEYVFATLNALTGSSLITSLFVSLLCTASIWALVSPHYEHINKALLAAVIFSPHFLIWSGSIGKEVLAITAFCIMSKCIADAISRKRINLSLLLLSSLGAFAIRPHFFVCYAWLFFVVVLNDRTVLRSLSTAGMLAFIAILALGTVPGVLNVEVAIEHRAVDVLRESREMFIFYREAKSTRLDVEMASWSDIVQAMVWGIPFSIIGPLPLEAVRNPFYFLAFLEGTVNLAILLYLLFILGSAPSSARIRKIVVVGLFPAIALALVAHFPYAVYNAGSALRYKQSLVPLFYFLPLIILAISDGREASLRGTPRPVSRRLAFTRETRS